MPPPLEEGFTVPGPDVKPPGRNATQADIDFFTQLATTFNQGLEEVGGAKWREVLGREAVAAAAAQLRAAADDGGSGG